MFKKIYQVLGSPKTWSADALLRNLIKNSGLLLSANLIAVLCGFLTFTLAARHLGASQFGLLVLVSSYVLVVDRLVNFNSWQAIIKYGAEYCESSQLEGLKPLIKFGICVDLATAIFGAVLAAGAAWGVGTWMGWESQTVLYSMLYSSTIVFHLSGVPTGLLKLLDCFSIVSTHIVAAACIKLTATLLAWGLGSGLPGYLLAWGVADICGHLLLLGLAYRQLRKRNIHTFMASNGLGILQRHPRILRFIWTTNLNSSVRMTTRELDVFVVAGYLGPHAVGLYKIAKLYSTAVGTLISPMYVSIYPELSKMVANNQTKELVQFISRCSALAFAIATSAWLAMSVFGSWILTITLGPEYLEAQTVLLWYMLATIISAAAFPLQPTMLSLERPDISLLAHVSATTIYFITLPLLLEALGLTGAGVAYAIYYAAWASAMSWFLVSQLSQRSLNYASTT